MAIEFPEAYTIYEQMKTVLLGRTIQRVEISNPKSSVFRWGFSNLDKVDIQGEQIHLHLKERHLMFGDLIGKLLYHPAGNSPSPMAKILFHLDNEYRSHTTSLCMGMPAPSLWIRQMLSSKRRVFCRWIYNFHRNIQLKYSQRANVKLSCSRMCTVSNSKRQESITATGMTSCSWPGFCPPANPKISPLGILNNCIIILSKWSTMQPLRKAAWKSWISLVNGTDTGGYWASISKINPACAVEI